MPDPLPYRGSIVPGILTEREHSAIVRVLRVVEPGACVTVSVTWSGEEIDASIALASAGYITRALVHPRGPSAPMRWSRLEITPAGAAYLEQMRITTEIAPRAPKVTST